MKKLILSTITVTGLYLVLVTLLMNRDLTRDTFIGKYSPVYKAKILIALTQGMWTSMTPSGLMILFLTALLTGINLTLLFEKINILKKFDKLHLVVGGNSFLGIVGSGCVSCGLPILSLFGLSSSLIYLPFKGVEIQYLSLILLSSSLYMLIRSRKQVCDVNYGKT